MNQVQDGFSQGIGNAVVFKLQVIQGVNLGQAWNQNATNINSKVGKVGNINIVTLVM